MVGALRCVVGVEGQTALTGGTRVAHSDLAAERAYCLQTDILQLSMEGGGWRAVEDLYPLRCDRTTAVASPHAPRPLP